MTDVPSSITCPTCRERYARYHDERGRYVPYTPLGYVRVYIGDATQPLTAHSYAQLRSLVQPLAEHTTFRLVMVAGMAAVGEGCYTRVTQGFEVHSEAGACDGLALTMREAVATD